MNIAHHNPRPWLRRLAAVLWISGSMLGHAAVASPIPEPAQPTPFERPAWLPEDVAVDDRGLPLEGSLGGYSLMMGAGTRLVSMDLMAGDSHALAGMCLMAMSLSLQPSLDHLVQGDWIGGLSRSLGRMTALVLGGLTFYQMATAPAGEREGWAVAFQLTGAGFGAMMLWDMIDPPLTTAEPPSQLPVKLSVAPLIMASWAAAEENAAPVLGLRFSVTF